MYEYVTHSFSMGYDSKPIKVSDVEISDLVHQLSQNNFRVTNAQALTQETKVFEEDDIKLMKSGTFKQDNKQVDILEKYIIKGNFSHDSDDPDHDTIKFTIILENYEETYNLNTVKSVKCTVKGEADFTFPVSERLPELSNCLQMIYKGI